MPSWKVDRKGGVVPADVHVSCVRGCPGLTTGGPRSMSHTNARRSWWTWCFQAPKAVVVSWSLLFGSGWSASGPCSGQQ